MKYLLHQRQAPLKNLAKRWESPEGQEAQCAKLRIQKADWNILAQKDI